MAKGAVAKETILNKVKELFKDDYICTKSGKGYVWVDDGNGEKVQICISLTCPKTPVMEKEAAQSEMLDFEAEAPPATITKEEEENIDKLMRSLNLI